jgi:hypothetical protein
MKMTISTVNITLPSPPWIVKAAKPVPDSDSPGGLDFNRWFGAESLKPYNKNHVHYLFRFYWDDYGGQ